jgi:hypothetical protein
MALLFCSAGFCSPGFCGPGLDAMRVAEASV